MAHAKSTNLNDKTRLKGLNNEEGMSRKYLKSTSECPPCAKGSASRRRTARSAARSFRDGYISAAETVCKVLARGRGSTRGEPPKHSALLLCGLDEKMKRLGKDKKDTTQQFKTNENKTTRIYRY